MSPSAFARCICASCFASLTALPRACSQRGSLATFFSACIADLSCRVALQKVVLGYAEHLLFQPNLWSIAASYLERCARRCFL